MKNLDDLIASLERRDEEEISREEIERIIGKMIILVIKLDGII